MNSLGTTSRIVTEGPEGCHLAPDLPRVVVLRWEGLKGDKSGMLPPSFFAGDIDDHRTQARCHSCRGQR